MTSSFLPPRRGPLALACLAACAAAATVPLPARAQAAAAALPLVVVTGNPLRRADTPTPVTLLDGEALLLRRSATLGETLDGLPGVAATAFGPNASRPLIRGLGGDRVRLLVGGTASLDASAFSDDHALPVDPLVATRVEVLRGPAALFHGGSAIGGVVQVLDDRIPRTPDTDGFGGAAELRAGGAARERGGAAVLDGGRRGTFGWHLDAYGRDTDDLRVPRYVPRADGEALPVTGTVRNSASRTRGGAAGVSFSGDGLRIGAALDRHDTRYGIVAEPDVTIDLRRDQLRLEAESQRPLGPITGLRLSGSFTDYVHREREGDGSVGTTFATRGGDLRLEARHRPLGGVEGVVGVQHESSDFSALGEEAFVPGTRTRRTGVFVFEEGRAGPLTLTGGVRVEQVQVRSAGDPAGGDGRFGAPSQRRFTPRSAALGALLPLPGGWRANAVLARSERAPAAVELHADGVHAATGAYERGDATLGVERGTHVEAGLAWQATGPATPSLRLAMFQTRYAGFVSLRDTGTRVDETGAAVADGTPDALPLYRFTAARARLRGAEAEGQARLPGTIAGWQLTGVMRADVVRGVDLDRGEPLERLPPWRVGLGLQAVRAGWTLQADVDHRARQDRVPAVDTSTPGATLVHLSLVNRRTIGGADATLFARVENATDRLALQSTALATVRGLSPSPGRALRVGVRLAY